MPTNDKNRETFTTTASDCKFELIPTGENKPPKLVGYPIVFNQLSSARVASGKPGEKGLKNGELYYVRLKPGSVQYVKNRPVQALYNHDNGQILGSVANGSLAFSEDAYGVKMECIPPSTSYAYDVMALVRDKYIDGMSFGTFPITTNVIEEDGKKIVEYTSQLVDEFTITGSPAFIGTSVDVNYNAEKVEGVQPTPVLDDHATRLALFEIGEYSVDQVDASGVTADGPGEFVSACNDTIGSLTGVLDDCDDDEEYKAAVQSAKDAVSACLNNVSQQNLTAAAGACDKAGSLARTRSDSLSQQAALSCANLSKTIIEKIQ